jgi:hypothetical protein
LAKKEAQSEGWSGLAEAVRTFFDPEYAKRLGEIKSGDPVA